MNNPFVIFLMRLENLYNGVKCMFGLHEWTDPGDTGHLGLRWKRCHCGWWFELENKWYKHKGDV